MCTYNGMLFRFKEEGNPDTHNIDELQNFRLSEISQSQKQILYGSTYTRKVLRVSHGDRK